MAKSSVYVNGVSTFRKIRLLHGAYTNPPPATHLGRHIPPCEMVLGSPTFGLMVGGNDGLSRRDGVMYGMSTLPRTPRVIRGLTFSRGNWKMPPVSLGRKLKVSLRIGKVTD